MTWRHPGAQGGPPPVSTRLPHAAAAHLRPPPGTAKHRRAPPLDRGRPAPTLHRLPVTGRHTLVKIALDPYMIRNVPLLELPAVVAELGYEWIELSPREDFIPFFRHPRVDDATVRKFRKAL